MIFCSDLKLSVINFYVPLLGEPILEHEILPISVQIWPRIKYNVSGWITPVSWRVDVFQAPFSNVAELNVEKSKILPSQMISGVSFLIHQVSRALNRSGSLAKQQKAFHLIVVSTSATAAHLCLTTSTRPPIGTSIVLVYGIQIAPVWSPPPPNLCYRDA